MSLPKYEYNGAVGIVEIAKENRVNASTLIYRMRSRGMTIAEAVSVKRRKKGKKRPPKAPKMGLKKPVDMCANWALALGVQL